MLVKEDVELQVHKTLERLIGFYFTKALYDVLFGTTERARPFQLQSCCSCRKMTSLARIATLHTLVHIAHHISIATTCCIYHLARLIGRNVVENSAT